ncbi:hypothetical protein [Bdellovibrio bacteriovorus]|uniref:Uncharacterized protein n=1 Tax=Bdellovibrio bacteriovorus TaxID=959 RepID=A0A1Z3N8W8_BDEBC|nr:hypothetical protein [Bdellovibrio bacteriovorus]ASD63922.1 hypothetical protein B9G79_10255 [Bdellovibrio bacteriovorus]
MTEKKNKSVRGPDLRKKIIDSQEKGENYRSEHQGTDLIDTNTVHEDQTTRNRSSSEHSSKK